MNRRADVWETPCGKWYAQVYYSPPALTGGLAYSSFTSDTLADAVTTITEYAAKNGWDYDVTMHAFTATEPFTIMHPPETENV